MALVGILSTMLLQREFVTGWRKAINDHRLDPTERAAAAEALTCARGEGSDALGDLAICLGGDPDERVRSACAAGMAAVAAEAEEALPSLEPSLLDDRSSKVRSAAARAIGSFEEEARSAVPSLVAALDDSRLEVNSVDSRLISSEERRCS